MCRALPMLPRPGSHYDTPCVLFSRDNGGAHVVDSCCLPGFEAAKFRCITIHDASTASSTSTA